jgi:hypothetical protein
MNPEASEQPGLLSRRGAVKTAAGVAAAGAVLAASARTPAEAAAAPSGAVAGPDAQAAQGAAATITAGESLVVHVRDVQTGELNFYVGEREVTVYDRALAARLANAAK